MSEPTSTRATSPAGRPLLILLGALVLILAVLFRDSFKPEMAMFANDGPLGLMKSRVYETPEALRSVWIDLNWLGGDGGNLPPTVSSLLVWILGPLGSNKFYPAITVLFLGCSAWLFFRQLRFHPAVCILGGLAAALNSDFFSYACWGLGSLTMCVGSVFLCLAAVASPHKTWIRITLGGVALGHALMEGFDNGAIFSLYVAAFALAFSILHPSQKGADNRRFLSGAVQVAALAGVSALVASQILITLVRGNISGAVGMAQDEQSKAERWGFATQWSLPPDETIRAIIPGLYGYRMDTPGGGQYWGRVGMDLSWDPYWQTEPRDPAKRPNAMIRFSGAGHYCGIMVVLLAAFAVANSFRSHGPLSAVEKRWIWFWAAAALLSLLFSYGRFAPFYQFIYALPYFSTIRNPVKFLHPMNFSLVILCGYGLQALWLGWITQHGQGKARASAVNSTLEEEWNRRFAVGMGILVALAAAGWLVFRARRSGLIAYLGEVGFDPSTAGEIASFSAGEVLVFVVTLALSCALLASVVLRRWGAGRSAALALALGLIITLDLARANAPWVVHYDWKARYVTNPVFDLLRRAPHEGRVTGRLPFRLGGEAGQLLNAVRSIYDVEWLQYQFRFFDIQSIDIVQMPRTPADYNAFVGAMGPNLLRTWELGNVRWLLTLAPLVEPMNSQLDPIQKRFRLHTAFSISQNPDGTFGVETNENGPFGLVEFSGALPRAMLFDQWRSGVTDDDALGMLVSTNFDPRALVLVSDAIPAPSVDTVTQPAGTVQYIEYSPREFSMKTSTRTPSVLLVNDRYDPNWRVEVDGREEPVLRANFIGRGVYLTAGEHTVRFIFSPPIGWLLVSWGTLIAGALLGLSLAVQGRTSREPPPSS